MIGLEDKQDIEKWKRQLRTIKNDLWGLVRSRIVGQKDREDITDSLSACLNRYNKILFKYEDVIETLTRKASESNSKKEK